MKRPHLSWKLRSSGFTLIELMIVVVVVAILATIAVPSYAEYVRRTNRTAAKALLTELISRQESFRADRKSYALSLAALGTPSPLYLQSDGDTVDTAAGAIYQITLESPTVTSFTLAATPVGSQVADTKCAVLRLSASGIRAASGTSGIACWER